MSETSETQKCTLTFNNGREPEEKVGYDAMNLLPTMIVFVWAEAGVTAGYPLHSIDSFVTSDVKVH